MRERIYTFLDAWTNWKRGDQKFPIAFYGDSTVDGYKTTGCNKTTEPGRDHVNPKSFCKLAEEKLRRMCNNNVLRVYNAGYSGQTAQWGLSNIDNTFIETPYSDVKMIGIGFGINDRLLYNRITTLRGEFKRVVKAMIEWCYDNNIQPFLVTTQATIEPGVDSVYAKNYPFRTNGVVSTVCNTIKHELAKEYNLELIDMNKFTEIFLNYSKIASNNIVMDRLHFGDAGHEYESGVVVKHFCPYVIDVDGVTKIDFNSQRLFNSVPEDKLSFGSYNSKFKTYANYVKSNIYDNNIMTVYVFVNSKKPLYLKGTKNSTNSSTYIKVDGQRKGFTALSTNFGTLDLGFHKLEVWTHTSKYVDFKGFIIE